MGTPNFDNRPFRLNFEVTALIADEAIAAQFETTFEDDFVHAVGIDPNEIDKRPFR